MTPHTHYPTIPQTTTLLSRVADHITRPSLDGVVYRFQNQAVEIVRQDQYGVVIATLDKRQTLYTTTGMVCTMLVPLERIIAIRLEQE